MAALTGNTLTTLNDLHLAARPDGGPVEGWHRGAFLYDFICEKVVLPPGINRQVFPKIASAGLAMTAGTYAELDITTDSAISTDGTTLTAAFVSASVPISQAALEFARGDEVVRQEIEPAAMDRVNTDVLTLQASFANVLNTNAMTPAIFREGFFDFMAVKPQGQIYVAAMRLEAYEQLVEGLATTSAAVTPIMASWMGDLTAVGTQGMNYLGVQIFASVSVPQVDANHWGTGFYAGSEWLTAPNAQGRSGLIGSTAKMVYAPDQAGNFIRVETSRLAGGADGRIGMRVIPYMVYGVGLVNDGSSNSNGFLLQTNKV